MLLKICDSNLKFSGPFAETKSAKEYVSLLVDDPPKDCHYEIVDWFEKGDGVLVDSEKIANEVFARVLSEECGFTLSLDHMFQTFVGHSSSQCMAI